MRAAASYRALLVLLLDLVLLRALSRAFRLRFVAKQTIALFRQQLCEQRTLPLHLSFEPGHARRVCIDGGLMPQHNLNVRTLETNRWRRVISRHRCWFDRCIYGCCWCTSNRYQYS